MSLKFCQKLPKLELHAHLNGSLSETTLSAIGVPIDYQKYYQSIRNVSIDARERLNYVFELFRVAHNATKSTGAVYAATRRVIEEYHADNVVYLELRSTPREEDNMSKREYLEAVIRAIRDQDLVVVKLLPSIDRTHSLKTSTEALDLILEMSQLYPGVIKGVDLCGNPHQGRFFKELFKKARESGLKVTLHCAEIANDEEVLEMLEFKPDRIGHGTFLHPKAGGSKEIWELYQTLKIPIECCLTSNVLCGTVKNYEEHHVKDWFKNGLPFSINTDDKGVFCTSLTEEFHYAYKNVGLSKNDLFECSLKAVEYSFASSLEKEQLKQQLLQWRREHDFLFR